jgi:hypothetical protein
MLRGMLFFALAVVSVTLANLFAQMPRRQKNGMRRPPFTPSLARRFSFAWCLGVALLIVGAALVKRAATIVVGLGLAIACILVTAFIAICTIIMLVKYFWMYPH